MKITVNAIIGLSPKTTLRLGFLLLFLPLFIATTVSAQNVTSNDPTIDMSEFPVVTYCIDPDWMPYEAIRNNQHVGMSADYMRFIGLMAEVNFVLVKTRTWAETLENLKTGKCEVASMLNRSPLREEYLLFTQPFFNGTNVLVSTDEYGFIQGYENIGDRKLGAVSGYRQAEYIANYYPEIDLRLAANEAVGLQLLAEGEIDLFIGSLLSINSKIQKSGYNNLHIAGIAEPQDILSMGIANNNEALLNKLDAAIEQIPEWLHVEIYKEWNNVRVIESIDYRSLWIAAGLLVLLSLIGYWRQRIVRQFNHQLMAKNEQLELLQKELIEKNHSLELISMRDPLTSMFNRNFMCDRCEQERQHSLRNNSPTSLIILDIDFFKPVNDNHGHTAGDTVLKELAIRIANVVREMDVAARWGGEEFIILCPNTKKQDALLLAQRLNVDVAKHPFSQVGKITCSLGVAELRADESFIQWFDRADEALYKAKNTGRNKVICAE